MKSPEESAIRNRRGKWSQAGVPHRGWECVDFEDLEEPRETCQMCESTEIRYVHIMRHPDYSQELRCGCICAGALQRDYIAARDRERKARNHAKRRANWLTRQWRTSTKGNEYLNVDGFNLVIFRTNAGWTARFTYRDDESFIWQLKKSFERVGTAKLAAFDMLLKLTAVPFDVLASRHTTRGVQ